MCAEEKSSDRFYFDVALRLVEKAKEIVGGAPVHEALVERAALCVIGYYQDMIADAGLWHGFSDECRRLYGTPVPFFKVSEDYVDYELNRKMSVFSCGTLSLCIPTTGESIRSILFS